MKKVLEIELEEECLVCPKLSLQTVTEMYENYTDDGTKLYNIYNVHRCRHLAFCQEVRKAWEEVRKNDSSNS